MEEVILFRVFSPSPKDVTQDESAKSASHAILSILLKFAPASNKDDKGHGQVKFDQTIRIDVLRINLVVITK